MFNLIMFLCILGLAIFAFYALERGKRERLERLETPPEDPTISLFDIEAEADGMFDDEVVLLSDSKTEESRYERLPPTWREFCDQTQERLYRRLAS